MDTSSKRLGIYKVGDVTKVKDIKGRTVKGEIIKLFETKDHGWAVVKGESDRNHLLCIG